MIDVVHPVPPGIGPYEARAEVSYPNPIEIDEARLNMQPDPDCRQAP
jgi:hypothetical protein